MVTRIAEDPVWVTQGTPVRGGRVRGREAAVHELYLAEYGRLAGWVGHLVDDRETARDIATEAFVRLLSRWTTVQEPRAWLYMTCTNLVRDMWRRQQRERKAYARMAEPAGVTPAGDPSVRDLVERLPDKMRTVVLLHYYADLSVHEIATLLGRADGTVKRTLFDARQRLQANLAAADLEGLR
jgi:RNA polymerase sigma-70 factor (ECF subfamily)